MKTVTTKKGTVLPLTNLKGKDYLMVAYRIQWFAEEVPNFHISTAFLALDDTQTIAQVTVIVLNEQGQALRKAVGTKRETKADFSDHTEKAETGALGRALIQLGYGTQYALADLDEGTRLADSPLPDPRELAKHQSEQTASVVANNAPIGSTKGKVSSFRKTKTETKTETKAETTTPIKTEGNGSDGEWL